MGRNLAIGILLSTTIVLGIALIGFMRQKESATLDSRRWNALVKSFEEETNKNIALVNKVADLEGRYSRLSNDLAQTSRLTSSNQVLSLAIQAANQGLNQRDATIANLKGQNEALARQAGELENLITTLEIQIGDTQKKLDESEGERAFVEKEIKHSKAEKAELERRFSDIDIIMAQAKHLKEEASIAKRFDRSRSQPKSSQKAFGTDRRDLLTNAAADPITEVRLYHDENGISVIEATPHLDIGSSRPLKPNETFKVVVRADAAVFGVEQATNLPVGVWMLASDQIELRDEQMKILNLNPATNTSAPVIFQLQVKSDLRGASKGIVAAYFVYDGCPCGKVEKRVRFAQRSVGSEVLNKSDQSTEEVPTLKIHQCHSKPDLTVIITDPQHDRRHMSCCVFAPALKDFTNGVTADWILTSSSFDFVNQFMADFVDGNQNNEQRFASLKGAGLQLFAQAPKVFQQAYWDLIDQKLPIKTIYIVSEEPFIPWELMVPSRFRKGQQENDLFSLGAQYSVARWLPLDNTAAPCEIRLTSAKVLAPEYTGNLDPLTNAFSEVSFVLANFNGERIRPADFHHINDYLGKHNADLLHFVGHGDSKDAAGKQRLYIEGTDSTLDSTQLLGMGGVEMFCHRNQPLVFLNACQVGRNTPGLIGVAGFPSSFIQLGASGVIAPLWSVEDETASAVAQEFYKKVLSQPETPFAEIMRQIRRHAYEPGTQGDTTYAAYCFYGDPFAHQPLRH